MSTRKWHELVCDRCYAVCPIGQRRVTTVLRRTAHRAGWVRTKKGQLPNQHGAEYDQPAEDLCPECARRLGATK